MVGLIGAMSVEMELLEQQMIQPAERHIGTDIFLSGKLFGQDAVIAVCGPGKVNAAICTWSMIQHYHPRWILNLGVAGAGDRTVDIGDLVVATDTVQHDMDTSPMGDPVGYVSKVGMIRFPCDEALRRQLLAAARHTVGDRVHEGTIATGDQFISDLTKRESIHSRFGAKAVEMEGAAVGHACHIGQVPYGVLRAISDNADGDSPADFPAFAAKAAAVTQQVIQHLLQSEGCVP